MPFFDQNPLEKLMLQHEDAERVLDLRGRSSREAMEAVEALLHGPRSAGSCLIRFDAARDDGQETLFLPIGRRLLQARREGLLSRCLPATDGAGYFIAFGA